MEREDPWDENDGEELEAGIMRADHSFGADLRGLCAPLSYPPVPGRLRWGVATSANQIEGSTAVRQ